MVFGLGTKQKTKKTSTKSKAKSTGKKAAQSDEAAELLKKMEDKKAAGDCPFC